MVAINTLIFALTLSSAALAAPVKNGKPRTAEEVIPSRVLGQPTCPKEWAAFNVSNSAVFSDIPLETAWSHLGNFCEVTWQGFDFKGVKGSCQKVHSFRTYGIGNLKFVERLDHIFATPRPITNSQRLRRKLADYIPWWSSSSPDVTVDADSEIIPGGRGPHSSHDNTSPAGGSVSTHRHSGFGGRKNSIAQQSTMEAPKEFHAMVYGLIGETKMAGAIVKNMHTLLKIEKEGNGSKISWDVLGCSDAAELVEDVFMELHDGALLNAGMSLKAEIKMADDESTGTEPVPAVSQRGL